MIKDSMTRWLFFHNKFSN